jgi:hypothetical protein
MENKEYSLSDNWRENKSTDKGQDLASVLDSARVMAQSLIPNVEVTFAGIRTARTDRKTIELSAAYTDGPSPLSGHKVDQLLGLTVHEMGHVMFSEDKPEFVNKVTQICFGSNYIPHNDKLNFNDLIDIFEDIYIDHIMSGYPGYKDYLQCQLRASAGDHDPAVLLAPLKVKCSRTDILNAIAELGIFGAQLPSDVTNENLSTLQTILTYVQMMILKKVTKEQAIRESWSIIRKLPEFVDHEADGLFKPQKSKDEDDDIEQNNQKDENFDEGIDKAEEHDDSDAGNSDKQEQNNEQVNSNPDDKDSDSDSVDEDSNPDDNEESEADDNSSDKNDDGDGELSKDEKCSEESNGENHPDEDELDDNQDNSNNENNEKDDENVSESETSSEESDSTTEGSNQEANSESGDGTDDSGTGEAEESGIGTEKDGDLDKPVDNRASIADYNANKDMSHKLDYDVDNHDKLDPETAKQVQKAITEKSDDLSALISNLAKDSTSKIIAYTPDEDANRVAVARQFASGSEEKTRRIMQTYRLKRTRDYRGLEHGRISNTRLHRAGYGDTRVFQRRERPDEIDMSICLLIDLSGSMQQDHDLIDQIIVAMSDALSKEKVEFIALGYSWSAGTYKNMKNAPGMKREAGTDGNVFIPRLYDKETHKINLKLDDGKVWGGTPSYEGLAAAIAQLMRLSHNKQKVLFHFTDGSPNQGQINHIPSLLKDARAHGITDIHIYMGDNYGITNMKIVYGDANVMQISNIRELPEIIDRELSRKLKI